MTTIAIPALPQSPTHLRTASAEANLPGVALAGLLICEDTQLLCTLNRALDHMKIETALALDAEDAEEQLRTATFDVVIIDFANAESGKAILQHLRRSKVNRDCVAIAIVDNVLGHRDAFKCGANFTVPRTHKTDQAIQCLRSSYFLILRTKRLAINASATITRGQNAVSTKAVVRNLSEKRLGLSGTAGVLEGDVCSVEFYLAEVKATINARVRAIRVDENGELDGEFVSVDGSGTKSIQDWISTALLGRVQ